MSRAELTLGAIGALDRHITHYGPLSNITVGG